MSDLQTAIQTLDQVSKTKGAGSKEKIKRLLAEGANNDIFREIIMIAMNPYVVFHVKKFQLKHFARSDANFSLFADLCSRLSQRLITGNDAIAEVEETLACYTEETAEWLARILRKDLKAGFSAESYNEAVFGDEEHPDGVPVYKCMLAKKMAPKYKWKFPLQVDAKYDGQRCNAYVEASVDYKARSGKTMEHVEGIFDDELQYIMDIAGVPLVFDGEVKAADFTQTMNAKGKKNVDARNSLIFFVYDVLTLEEWTNRKTTRTLKQRMEWMREIISDEHEKVKIAVSKVVNNETEAREFYAELVEEGYEGAVLKDLDATYVWDRDTAWTKWKPVDTFDLRIVGFYPGRPGTKYEHMLGGVHVEGEDENGTKITCNVGSGWSDEEREKVWNNQEDYLGKMIECEADPNLSKIDGRGSLAMRWGVFKKFRPDKDK